MKILIDNSNLFAGGGIQVATSFLKDLNRLNLPHNYVVVQSFKSTRAVLKRDFKNDFEFIDLTLRDQKFLLHRIRSMKEIESRVRPDIIFTVFGPSYHKSNVPKIVGFAIPSLIYPTSPFFKKLTLTDFLKLKLLDAIKFHFFRRNSTGLIFETENARKIISLKLNNQFKTYTVSNTLNSIFHNPLEWERVSIEKADFNILYITAPYPHKNLDIVGKVIKELLHLDENLKFKFHLSVSKDDVDIEEIYNKYINYLGHVTLPNIPSLYSQMNLLFMPSLLEVFSTSYLEAMFMKVPIIASDMEFSRDICKDAAIYCNPIDPKDYAKRIFELISSQSLRQKLIQNGKANLSRFGTSEDRTLKYIQILEENAINQR